MLRRIFALWAFCALWLALPPPAAAAVHEYRLDNGLKLIVKEDHRAPVVVSQVWYKVGSSYEHRGITGISHLLEHMMFKGTDHYKTGDFSRIVAENGGDDNAFTTRDYTAYFQKLGRDRLEVSFRLESDRMRNLAFSDEELAKEREVVIEERRMRTEDNPEALAYEVFTASAYLASPYRSPVIGWMDDIKGIAPAELRDWYRRWYAPDNATVVVVGDVEPEAVLALAKQYFGPLQGERIAPPKPTAEPEQKGERRITVKIPAELPYLILGYKTPSLATAAEPWEPYALEVLGNLLDSGDSSRLADRLVRGAQVAASAGAGYDGAARLDELFLLEGVPAEGKGVKELEEALRAQVAELRERPVAADELERIKAQVVASDVYQRDSVFYQALQIGKLESLGLGWQRGEEYVERIRAVTAGQVQAVAKKYLTDERLTVAILDPQPLDPSKPRPHSGGMGGGPIR